MKNEINQLASGYTEIYISKVHEYFLVHELLTIYHLIERIEDTTAGSTVLEKGNVEIMYN